MKQQVHLLPETLQIPFIAKAEDAFREGLKLIVKRCGWERAMNRLMHSFEDLKKWVRLHAHGRDIYLNSGLTMNE